MMKGRKQEEEGGRETKREREEREGRREGEGGKERGGRERENKRGYLCPKLSHHLCRAKDARLLPLLLRVRRQHRQRIFERGHTDTVHKHIRPMRK